MGIANQLELELEQHLSLLQHQGGKETTSRMI